MAKFNIGDEVEMRDSSDENWMMGTVTQVDPVMVQLAAGGSSYKFEQVRLRNKNSNDFDMEKNQRIAKEEDADPLAANPFQLSYWEPENPEFWNKWGKKIAYRNLAVSTAVLFLSFAIWTQWGGIAAQIISAHEKDKSIYAFGYDENDTKAHNAAVALLGPIAGIAGGTQRLVHTFSVNPCGGRTTNVMSMVFAFIPMLLAGVALSNDNANLWFLYLMAMMSGIGGGAFSSCMSNMSFLFPSRLQGTCLGVLGGVGNLGVSIQAQAVPRLSGIGLCFAGKTGECNAGPFGGKYVYNSLYMWAAVCLMTAFISFFYMVDMPNHGRDLSNVIDDTIHGGAGRCAKCINCMKVAFIRTFNSNWGLFTRIQLFGWFGSVIVMLLFIASNPFVTGSPGLVIGRAFLFSGLVCACTGGALFLLSTGHVRERLTLQLQTGLLKDRNTVYFTLLYIMTFGSFIGYAGAFPKLIKTVFKGDPTKYAWMGAFFGSFARVFGGILCDFLPGGLVTQIAMTVQVISTVIAGILVRIAQDSSDPSGLFGAFVFFIISLFTATGVGNASTFKQFATYCEKDPEKRGPMLGLTAAIAAYGAFIIPTIFGAGIKFGFLDICFYIFSIYYIVCGVINYWFYAREGAQYPC